MPKIRVYIETGFEGEARNDVIEIPDEEWDALSEYDKDERLGEEALSFRDSYISCGAYVITDEDEGNYD